MGLEYISQPQVFLAPITAVNGVQGINNPYPLLTTYQSWVSTGTVNTSAFPIPGSWTMLDAPGSFIVTVGNVIQSPTDYSIDRNNRILTFSSIITAGIEIGVTQLATASPSATSFNSIQSVSGNFTNLSALNGNVNNLFVNNLTALSATINVIDITVHELSGFRVTGNLLVDGITTTNTLSAGNTTTNTLSAGNTTTNTLSAGVAATQSLSSRFINLEHSTPNDGINPVLFIGERGDGSGGTVAGSLTGYNVTYSETANRLLISTQFGAVTPLTAVSIDSTGNVGIGTDRPGNRLTVVGDISASGNVIGYNSTIYHHATGFGAAPNTITPYFSAAAGFIMLDPFRRYRLDIEAFYTKAVTPGAVTFTLSATAPFVYATGSLVHTTALGYTNVGATPVHTAGVVASAATLAFSPGNSIGGLSVTNHYGSFTYYIETSSVPTVANLFVTTPFGTGQISPGRGSYWQETVIG